MHSARHFWPELSVVDGPQDCEAYGRPMPSGVVKFQIIKSNFGLRTCHLESLQFELKNRIISEIYFFKES